MKTYKTDYGDVACFENDFYFANSLSNGKIFDQDMIETQLAPYILRSETILDIGAHIGSHTMIYSKLNPSANIYSFEPQSKIFDLLEININSNNIKNVTILNNAVGNEIKRVRMASFISDGPNANTTVEYDDTRDFNFGGMALGSDGEETSMITIDCLNLMGCDFMKIDVEGAEKLVIAGAINTIKKYKPIIFYECNQKKIPSSITVSVHDMIKSLGDYEITEMDDSNYLALPNCNV